MSFKYVIGAFDARVGSAATKLVLIKLADNANDQGVCWPSYQTIADHCEMSKRSVINHIHKLESLGLVRVIHRKKEDGNNQSNMFQLYLPSEKSAPPSEKSAPPLVKNLHPEPVTIESVNEPSNKDLIEQVQSNDSDAAFERYWTESGMRKMGKAKAKSIFDRICKKHGGAEQFATMLIKDCQSRLQVGQVGFDAMHPTTYLNGERWNDELRLPSQIQQPVKQNHLLNAAANMALQGSVDGLHQIGLLGDNND